MKEDGSFTFPTWKTFCEDFAKAFISSTIEQDAQQNYALVYKEVEQLLNFPQNSRHWQKKLPLKKRQKVNIIFTRETKKQERPQYHCEKSF